MMGDDEKNHLKETVKPYLQFRKELQHFSMVHLFRLCKTKCYDTGLSACCTKEGVITYFADMVVNLLHSDPAQTSRFKEHLDRPRNDTLCVYMGESGCVWKIKPIVCEMFFCDWLLEETANRNPATAVEIEKFNTLKKQFLWPDKPVLFDAIETIFLEKKLEATTMYYHLSPGLKAIKKKAGLI